MPCKHMWTLSCSFRVVMISAFLTAHGWSPGAGEGGGRHRMDAVLHQLQDQFSGRPSGRRLPQLLAPQPQRRNPVGYSARGAAEKPDNILDMHGQIRVDV